MKTRSPFVSLLALLSALTLTLPPDVLAQAAQAAPAQRAGQVSRVVPTANIQRGAQQVAAAPQSPVFWQDTVATDRGGRARIALDDGSVLNLGSDSSLVVSKHDAGAQQTELELTFGRLRSNVVKLAQPGAGYKVRTRNAVAGVVGTDFFLSFINGITQLMVFEGLVELCNLAGQCVTLAAGQVSMIRGDQQPEPPAQASQAQVVEAGQATQVQAVAAVAPAAAGVSTLTIVMMVVAVVVPAVVVPSVSHAGGKEQGSCGPRTQPTQPTQPAC